MLQKIRPAVVKCKINFIIVVVVIIIVVVLILKIIRKI